MTSPPSKGHRSRGCSHYNTIGGEAANGREAGRRGPDARRLQTPRDTWAMGTTKARQGEKRRAPRRLTLVVAAVVTMLAVGVAAHAQASDPLSPARYAAIDAIKTAYVQLPDSPTASDFADVRRVCDALDRTDRLLALARTGCRTTVRILAAADVLSTCQTALGCSRAAGRLAVALGEQLSTTRATNHIVQAEVPAGPCRRYLRARAADLRSGTRLQHAYRVLQRGARTNDLATVRRAQRLMRQARGPVDPHATPARGRARFRRACAPAVLPPPLVVPPPPAPPPPTLGVSPRCVAPGDEIKLTGSGFSPEGPVDLVAKLDGANGHESETHPISPVADADGSIDGFGISLQRLASKDDVEETLALTAVDRTRIAAGAPPEMATSAPAKLILSVFDFDVPAWDGEHAKHVDPRETATFTARGFTPGKQLYIMYVVRGKLVKRLRLGALTGRCGNLRRTMREFPFRPVPAGDYSIYISPSKVAAPDRRARFYSHLRVTASKAVR